MVSFKLVAVAAAAHLVFADYDCYPASKQCCDTQDDQCRTADNANMSYCSSQKAACYMAAGYCNPYNSSDCPGGYPQSSPQAYPTSTQAYPTSSQGYPMSYPPTTYPVSSYPLSSYPLSSYPLSSYPLSSYSVPTYPMTTYPVTSYPISSYPVSSPPHGTGSYPITYGTSTCPVTSYVTHGSTTSPVVHTKTFVITQCATCSYSTPTTVVSKPHGSKPLPGSTGSIQQAAAANVKPAMGMLAILFGVALL